MRDEDKSKEQRIEDGVRPCQLADGERDFKLEPALDTLQADTARLQAILDTTVDGIITIDEKTMVQSFNKAAERIFGYSASEVVGHKVNMLMPSPYRENHDTYVGNYLRTGNRKIIGIGREVMGKRKDGSTFPLYLGVSEVWVGKQRFFTGILRDITELKRATEEIKSVARFPGESPHPVLRVASDGRLLYANATSSKLLRMFNCEVDQYLPDHWLGLIRESFDSGRNKEIEAQAGDTIYSLVLTPIVDADYVNIYGRDITEYKRAEGALRESEQKYRTLVESSSDAILMVDKERRIVSFNRAFLDLFGFKWHEVEGKSTKILHPSVESFVAFGDQAFPLVEETGFFRTEWELRRKDGTIFPVEETFSVIKAPDGVIKGFVAIVRDITQRKQAEEELARYHEHLEEMVAERTLDLENAHKALVQKEKLKTLGAISAELAHEIRNPLMSIGGFARRLKEKFPGVAEIEIILSESWRLEKILDRIKNYLKPVEIRPQECSVNAVIAECLDLISSELDKERVALDLHLASGLPRAYVDAGILVQVFINVIRNAAKVMNKTGKLEVKSFESDQNIHIYIRAPITGTKVKDQEHLLLPFGEDRQSISVPLCFKLLEGMGGLLSITQEENSVLFAASLLKALQPGPEVPEVREIGA